MKKLFGLIIFLGFLLLLGTAGASDAGTIDGSQMLLQISISAVMIAIGSIGFKRVDYENLTIDEDTYNSMFQKEIKINALGSANTESASTKTSKRIIAPINKGVKLKIERDITYAKF